MCGHELYIGHEAQVLRSTHIAAQLGCASENCTLAGRFAIGSWGQRSLQGLCYILWELRVRAEDTSSLPPTAPASLHTSPAYVVNHEPNPAQWPVSCMFAALQQRPAAILVRWSPLCLLWGMQARSLLVVLKEPGNVVVPLAVAAGFPTDAPGRCALTTGAIVDRFRRANVTPKPWKDCSPGEEQALCAALDGLIQQTDGPLADVAEVDGAAAMWAAVPDNGSD